LASALFKFDGLYILGAICEYFGVKIAMYFAWLGHYTTALSIPAIVGIFFWVRFFFHKVELIVVSSNLKSPAPIEKNRFFQG
jgi:hypothetical protein